VKTPKHSLRKIVSFLNNPEEDGGFWLPNIQRPFVWTEEQICRLFDSILREYPISTLLVWKTRNAVRCRKFIDNYHQDIKLSKFEVPTNEKRKCLVLDGQQRLQSLFIALKGSFEKRELYFDVFSGEIAAPDDVKFKFAFLDGPIEFPWIRFKDLVFGTADVYVATEALLAKAAQTVTAEERSKISRHVGLVFKTFHSDDGISYQELDSIENPELYREDDVVEVFIRANSGGTKLGKSDLLFSLLTASWDEAGSQMEDLLEDLNHHGFAFTRDFVLKTCLTLLDQGARYEVPKFRKPEVRAEIEKKWDDIAGAIRDVFDFVRGKTFIRCDKAIPSYLVLIPLVYTRYHFPEAWKHAHNVDEFLLRSLLTGAFSGTPDQIIDDCVEKLRQLKSFDANELFGVIRSKGRSLELTEDKFWHMGYDSDNVHLLFNLWYREFNYTPSFEDNFPQVDHVFPQSLLKAVKTKNPNTGRNDVQLYPLATRNQLGNCMLLTQQENGAGGKWDIPPDVWFSGKPNDYLEMHLIPKNPSLWKLDRYEDFISERKKLIRAKFQGLLASK